MTTTEKKWWDGSALLRLERKEGQAESYSDIMDMIYHTYIAQKENYLSHTRFNGGFDKDREDDIARATYIGERITWFLHKSRNMYREEIALEYLQDFIRDCPIINTSIDPQKVLMKFKYYYLDGAVTVDDDGNFVEWD